MRRLIWFGVGAAAGGYAVLRARRVATVLSPERLGARAAAVAAATRAFGTQVSEGAGRREGELRQGLLAGHPERDRIPSLIEPGRQPGVPLPTQDPLPHLTREVIAHGHR